MIEFSPALVFAILFMVALTAVLGWVLIWFDGEFTGHRTDSLGLAVTGLSLLWLAMTAQRGKHQDVSRS